MLHKKRAKFHARFKLKIRKVKSLLCPRSAQFVKEPDLVALPSDLQGQIRADQQDNPRIRKEGFERKNEYGRILVLYIISKPRSGISSGRKWENSRLEKSLSL